MVVAILSFQFAFRVSRKQFEDFNGNFVYIAVSLQICVRKHLFVRCQLLTRKRAWVVITVCPFSIINLIVQYSFDVKLFTLHVRRLLSLRLM